MMMASTASAAESGSRRPARSVLSDGTYDSIRAMLLDHTIPPGQRINIDSIARELDVSQTPVREALARLESDALVVKQPLRGYSATELLTADEVDDLFRFRELLEPWMSARAAEQRTDDDSTALMAEIERGRDSLDLDLDQTYGGLSRHDERFHHMIAQMARSPFVSDAYTRAHFQLHVYRVTQVGLAHLRAAEGSDIGDTELRVAMERERGLITIAEHARVAEAIIAGQKNAAAAHMLDHVQSARKRIPLLP
ncbi:GntR family transcriptional regulator [Microbacterium sp. P5_E9]